jgi:hypothetical protein
MTILLCEFVRIISFDHADIAIKQLGRVTQKIHTLAHPMPGRLWNSESPRDPMLRGEKLVQL